MPRTKKYTSNAERQQAYRQRQKEKSERFFNNIEEKYGQVVIHDLNNNTTTKTATLTGTILPLEEIKTVPSGDGDLDDKQMIEYWDFVTDYKGCSGEKIVWYCHCCGQCNSLVSGYCSRCLHSIHGENEIAREDFLLLHSECKPWAERIDKYWEFQRKRCNINDYGE